MPDVRRPLCLVDFHTSDQLYTAIGYKDPQSQIVTVTTSKSLSAPAGSWTMELMGGEWRNRIKPQDLVVIKMGERPGILDTVMIGLVDDCRRVRRVGSKGERVIRTKITGRDMGKVLVKAMIKWFPVLGDDKSFPIPFMADDLGALLQMAQFYTQDSMEIGTPASMINNIMRKVLPALMGFEVKFWRDNALTTATVRELLRFRLGRSPITIPFITTMAQFEGALWNYIASVQNSPLNELFVDTRTDYMEAVPDTEEDSWDVGKFSAAFGEDSAKAVLILRKTPFDKTDWDSLTTHDIDDEDIVEDDLGISDHENYNMFLAKPTYLDGLLRGNLETFVTPRYDAENIRRYGISYMEANLTGDFDDSNPDLIGMIEENSDKLKEWFGHNAELENGTIRLKGNGAIKIGQRVRNKSLGMVYYVETVNQSFTNFSDWQTTLSVTRGQRG